ncbi:Uncharacterised protein [Serratia quinivorans]|uniref:hypothetical protein n=1 Tax=Serratia quinivorans TaxID=137545 RepID=UPI0021787831|nr:hypothetical protein [Serratia quinivorans]CAI2056905.1 Uncharacterised protein [Serratia quinivorans]
MATFAVISDRDNEKLHVRVLEIFPEDDVMKADNRLIFIASSKDNLAKQITEKIESNGVHLKEYGRVIAFSITSYQGYHYTKVWEWLKGKVS